MNLNILQPVIDLIIGNKILVSFFGGSLIALFVKPVLGAVIKKIGILLRFKLKNFVYAKTNDPDFRALVFKFIAKAQKELAENSGQEKFEAVKKWVLDVTPDMFDQIAEHIIQELYNELKKPI